MENDLFRKAQLERGENQAGFWSRRINDKERLIYKIDETNIYFLECRYHYGDT